MSRRICARDGCSTEFEIPDRFLASGRGKYCSASCSSKSTHPGKALYVMTDEIRSAISKTSKETRLKKIMATYNVSSLAEYYLQEVLVKGKWFSGKKLKQALMTCGFVKDTSCQDCGWAEVNPHSNTIPTEVDHVNGDDMDCRPENLRIRCPNCHSLQPTHKGLNRGRTNKQLATYDGASGKSRPK